MHFPHTACIVRKSSSHVFHQFSCIMSDHTLLTDRKSNGALIKSTFLFK